jgi:aryl-alcohol dehydrogenase
MKSFAAAVSRYEDQPYEIETVSIGELRPVEVLIKVVGAGMCHSDMIVRDPSLGLSSMMPAILGHEGSGVVEAIGSAVTHVTPGDHVLVTFDSCGTCHSCLTGAPAYCAEFWPRNLTGRRPDGTASATAADGTEIANRWFAQSTFAEYAVTTERNLVVVDKDLPLELLGPLGCGMQTGAGTVLNEMKMGPGQGVVVFGAGAVGLAAVMAAKLSGAGEIVVVDLLESRLALAKELGATRVVRGDEPDLADKIRGDGEGMDFSFETTAVTELITCAIESLRRPGLAVLVGGGAGMLNVAPPALSGKKVTYVLEGSAVPHILLPQLIDYWKKGLFPFDKLIRTYPFADINLADADSAAGTTVKPVLLFS